jgi:hypothetical protein
MTVTNFHLAPPPKSVDGLLAVPIDIQRITATLTFDGATQICQGDATLEFTVGPQSGCPIFDLRQTITAAWLDGAALPVAKLAHHDFGGGADAQLRVIESLLAANSTHTLRVTYTLGAPQASAAGSYQPSIAWSSGPRLTFNFGFTDLGAGRYLEAWVPANLIFDQFRLDLELQVLNTPVAHTLITNGQITALGANHWMVNFPQRFTAFSPLVELRAADSLTSLTGTTTLPISGTTVSIEAWKLKSNPADLGAQINNLKGWLADNEHSTGPYIHDGRFVAFIHQGGMEYDGGTTTRTDALRHETFHSWWARGIKPASQPDAWFDEAWAEYNDNGAAISLPFDYTDPPVELCPRNPWIRQTTFNAYDAGNHFWEGVAALIGVANLRALMGEFYRNRNARPATTTGIEEFLVCRSGNSQLVDAFHRFVYGFDNPTSTPDLWLRDDPAHTGTDAWPGRFWDSPDLWVRNADDDGTTHQSPEFGQDNWFYARVHNRGATVARHFVVTFNIRQFAGTEFAYPQDFLPSVAAASGFDLKPGTSRIVKVRWPRNLIPPAGTSVCLLAALLTRADLPIPGRHVWEHNNLAQKNLTIVDLAPNDWFVLPFVVANVRSSAMRIFQLELTRPREHIGLEASLLHRSETVFQPVSRQILHRFESPPHPTLDDASLELDCGGRSLSITYDQISVTERLKASPKLLAALFERGVEVRFARGVSSQIPIVVPAQAQLVFGLHFKVPPETRRGDTLRLDLVQRDSRSKRLLGGIAIQINVR